MATAAFRLTFLVFPRDDAQFTALVESLAGTDGTAPDQLEGQLRVFYPQAVVHQRDRLGELDQSAESWYVYRDGSAVPARD
jgi:hypothetical protein